MACIFDEEKTHIKIRIIEEDQSIKLFNGSKNLLTMEEEYAYSPLAVRRLLIFLRTLNDKVRYQPGERQRITLANTEFEIQLL